MRETYNVVPSWHAHAHVLLSSQALARGLMRRYGRGRGARTTVIGMLGALGKTNETSSNLLLLRMFSARNSLRLYQCLHSHTITNHLPAGPAIAQAVGDDDGCGVPLDRRNNYRRLACHFEWKLVEELQLSIYTKFCKHGLCGCGDR